MKVKRVGVLMLGTDASGKGGIASVVSVLQREGFLARHGVHYLATHAAVSRWAKLGMALQACWRVLVICLRERPAIVHAHTASRASFFRKSLLLAIGRATGCRTVLHLHGGGFKVFATEELGALARWWVRHTLTRTSVVIALSEHWAEFLRSYAPGANVVVVVNSVELKAVQAGREQHGRVLYLGRADQRKGIFDLLAALAILRVSHPDLRLVIGGDGDLGQLAREVARQGLDDSVTILGWIGAQQKEQELAQAAIFALPSYDEGLPMAMLEAMAAAKAVVVTPVGGIPQAVSDGQNGLLVPVGDPEALARALGRLLDDERLRAELAAQARATVAARFSTAVVLGQLDAVYADLDLAATCAAPCHRADMGGA